jgi:hypothetical protein
MYGQGEHDLLAQWLAQIQPAFINEIDRITRRRKSEHLFHWHIQLQMEEFKTAHAFGFEFGGELSLDQDTAGGSRQQELTADVVDFQVTQGLVDFIEVQTQSGPHFRFKEQGDVVLEHFRQRMLLMSSRFRSTINDYNPQILGKYW